MDTLEWPIKKTKKVDNKKKYTYMKIYLYKKC